jgi:hypothetical protein
MITFYIYIKLEIILNGKNKLEKLFLSNRKKT